MATENKSNKLCSELVESKIKFRVNNISKLRKEFNGPSVNIRGMTFRPMIMPVEDVEGRYTSLGFFLACHVFAEGKEKKHRVKVVQKLIAQDGEAHDLVETFSFEHLTEDANLGLKFIEWHQMIKPTWRKNDSILLEIAFEIEEVSNLEVRNETQTTTVAARNTEHDTKDSEKEVPIANKNRRRRRNRTRLRAENLKEIDESQEKLTEKVKLVKPPMEEPKTEIKDMNLNLEKTETKNESDSEKEGDGCITQTEKRANVADDIKIETLESGDSNTIGSYEKIENSDEKNTDDKEHGRPEPTGEFQSAEFNSKDDGDSGSEYSLLNE